LKWSKFSFGFFFFGIYIEDE